MMSEVGAFEAKTQLPKLLERVQKGERFIITKHGHPVAELVPYRKRDTDKIRRAIENLKACQKTHSLGGLSVREMIEEGRKY
jgi:prevent-host-death family protein